MQPTFQNSQDFSVSRMLFLLNTTHRKLQSEENIYDSDSPLKAIQLLKIAQRLNDQLHYRESAQIRLPRPEHTESSVVVTSKMVDEDEDDDEEQEQEDDPFLAEMQSAIEVRHVEDYEPQVRELGSSEFGTPEAHVSNSRLENEPQSIITNVEEVLDRENIFGDDLAEIDITELDDSEMPVLSRQVSSGSIPSLYHSDSEDDELAEDVLERESLPGYHHHQHHHHTFASHPALNLLTKGYTITHHSLPHEGQAPTA